MSARKLNEFLDIESGDDSGSDVGYDSENAQESKGGSSRRKHTVTTSSRASKRQKVSEDNASDESEGEEGSLRIFPSDSESDKETTPNVNSTKKSTKSSLSSKKSTTENIKPPRKNKTGVIYMSSLPPYLKPSALKSLLIARGFSPITKVFLSPRVSNANASKGARVSSNKRRMYTDGWVEFESKRTAKICAETLNASIVGGPKGGWYHDDIWNMKYLRGFKWADLMEQVQREKKEAEAKRRIEDSRAKKEEKAFLEGLERGKVHEGMKRKREEKGRRNNIDGGKNHSAAGGGGDAIAQDRVRRVFKQNEVMGGGNAGGNGKKGTTGNKETKVDSDAKRVLAKIF